MSQSNEFLGSVRLLVALATYNEVQSLPGLVTQIRAALPAADILVVDDNSPDGTGDWCDSNTASDARLSCLHRASKLGLGSAAVAAFAWAIERNYDWIGTLDADGSHDPASFLAMIDAVAADGALDVVIGSRYVSGGRIEGWPLHRRIASRVINAVARTWLRLKTRDNSGAFRLYRVALLKKIRADALRTNSYAYLEEVLWQLRRSGAQFREIPITFRQRRSGYSKLNLNQSIRSLWDLLTLPLRK